MIADTKKVELEIKPAELPHIPMEVKSTRSMGQATEE